MEPIDPDVAAFMRIPPKPLVRRGGSAPLDDGATCLAVVPPAAAGAAAAAAAATAATNVVAAAGGFADDIALLDEDANVVATLADAHAGGTVSLAFAPGGRLLVSAGEDGTAAVWDVASRALVARLKCEGTDADRTPDGHTVGCVAISGDGATAACAAGKTVHAFDLSNGGADAEATRRTFPPVKGGVVTDLRFVAGSSDGGSGANRLLASYYGGVCLMSTEPGQPGVELEHGTNVLSVDGTPDLSWVVGGCMDSAVHIWHITQQPAGAEAGASEAAEATMAADGGAATNGGNGDDDEARPAPVTVACPDGSKLTLVELTCGGYAGKVARVDFGAAPGDGRPLLASSGGHACMVWDFGGAGPAGTAPTILLGHTKAVDCQAWHPTKPGVLVTGGRDGRLLVYETENAAEGMDEGMPALCAPAALDAAPTEEVIAVAWTPSGTLLSAHANGSIQSWTLEL